VAVVMTIAGAGVGADMVVEVGTEKT